MVAGSGEPEAAESAYSSFAEVWLDGIWEHPGHFEAELLLETTIFQWWKEPEWQKAKGKDVHLSPWHSNVGHQ